MPTSNSSDSEGDAVGVPRYRGEGNTAKRRSKKAKTTLENLSEEAAAGHKECLAVARYIPRALDAFCDIKEVIQTCIIFDNAEENEITYKMAERLENIIDDRTQIQYRQTFDYVCAHAPYLMGLIGNKPKAAELNVLMKEMQALIMHIRSEDASRLCKFVIRYAAPNPDVQVVQPLVCPDTKEGRARMGFNHPQLGALLCPAKYLKDYLLSPWGMRVQFNDPNDSANVTASVWPAFLYPGDIPGADYDPNSISNGLFRGYLVLKHILTSPSSALNERAKGARGGNAKIHGVKTIDAEHIAYAAMHARFIISSAEKWSEQDGIFNYHDFYYRIIHVIRETKDRKWADGLLKYYNGKIFGNAQGLVSKGRAIPDDGDDDLLEMERQFEEAQADESRYQTPAHEDLEEERGQIEDIELGYVSPAHDRAVITLTESSFSASSSSRSLGSGPSITPTDSSFSGSSGSRSLGSGPSALKRKQVIDDFFNDNSPLTEDEDERQDEEPLTKRKSGRITKGKSTTKPLKSSGHAQKKK